MDNPTSGQLQEALSHVDVLNRLRILECPHCAIVFALPMQNYLNRVQSAGHIHCPNGDVIELVPSDESPAGLVAMNMQLLCDLRQEQHHVSKLHEELSRRPLPSTTEMNDAEFKRRILILENRAERTSYGKAICRFCGHSCAMPNGFRSHLRRNHREDVAGLAADYFDA